MCCMQIGECQPASGGAWVHNHNHVAIDDDDVVDNGDDKIKVVQDDKESVNSHSNDRDHKVGDGDGIERV